MMTTATHVGAGSYRAPGSDRAHTRARVPYITYIAAAIAVVTLMAACATSKKAGLDQPGSARSGLDQPGSARKLSFVQKVYDNAVYTKNISSKIDLTLGKGDDAISVAGTLRMRRDEVIRIQITPLGLMEVGRLEFTPDSVLVMDRMNKEYARAAYDQLPFLAANGIDFYTLQSLFWNELFLPGEPVLKESHLKLFDVDIYNTSGLLPITYAVETGSGRARMSYTWSADATTGLIATTNITYSDPAKGAASLRCSYADFVPVGSKQFPTETALSFSTGMIKGAEGMGMTLRLKAIDTSTDWEATTTVSGKYRRVTASDILKKLMSL